MRSFGESGGVFGASLRLYSVSRNAHEGVLVKFRLLRCRSTICALSDAISRIHLAFTHKLRNDTTRAYSKSSPVRC